MNAEDILGIGTERLMSLQSFDEVKELYDGITDREVIEWDSETEIKRNMEDPAVSDDRGLDDFNVWSQDYLRFDEHSDGFIIYEIKIGTLFAYRCTNGEEHIILNDKEIYKCPHNQNRPSIRDLHEYHRLICSTSLVTLPPSLETTYIT